VLIILFSAAVKEKKGEDIYLLGNDASFLQLRNRIKSYIEFVQTFAFSILGKRKWNGIVKNESQINELQNNFDTVLTVSDEAFIILCVVNYRERWFEETKNEMLNNQLRGQSDVTQETNQVNQLPVSTMISFPEGCCGTTFASEEKVCALSYVLDIYSLFV